MATRARNKIIRVSKRILLLASPLASRVHGPSTRNNLQPSLSLPPHMRPSYRPRNQNSSSSYGNRGSSSGRGGGIYGGRGGGLTGGAGAASSSRVTAPRPIQTSSLKAESGVFDLTTILVPASSKEKGGTWGRASLTSVEPKPPAAAAPLGASAPAKQPPPLVPSRDAAASPASTERSSSPDEQAELGGRAARGFSDGGHPGRNDAATAAVWAPTGGGPTPAGSMDSHRPHYRADPPYEMSGDVRRQDPFPRHEPAARMSPIVASAHAAPLSGELFPPLGRQREPTAETRGTLGASSGAGPARREEGAGRPQDAAPASAPSLVVFPDAPTAPPPSVFQTPPPDEADTEAERERRRRALALEQQRLILEQVEASRRAAAGSTKAGSNKKSAPGQPVSVIMRRTATQNPKKDSEGVEKNDVRSTPPVQPKVSRKGPRTKGKLYSRRADGSLVEEGSGDTLSGPAVDGNDDDDDGGANDDERAAESAAEPVAPKASNAPANPSKGKPSAKKNWGSKNRRPRKHQVAALADG